MPIQKVLVTGGAGFIGQHLVRALLQTGLEVVVLDNFSVGKRENLPQGVTLVEGDLLDEQVLDQALEGVDAVCHLAAVVSVRASMDNFVTDAEVNILGSLKLLRALQRRQPQVKKAILASSMAVYADSSTPHPLPESWNTTPLSPYGAAKLAAEHYWNLLCPQAGVEGTVLRLFNTWGPGQTPSPYVGVLTHFARRLGSGKPMQIFGDGEQRRDFVHVEDVAQAFVKVLSHPASGRILNVGTGIATSVNQLATTLLAAYEKHLDLPSGSQWQPPASAAVEHRPPQPGELRNAIADISAARSVLNYLPSRKFDEEELFKLLPSLLGS